MYIVNFFLCFLLYIQKIYVFDVNNTNFNTIPNQIIENNSSFTAPLSNTAESNPTQATPILNTLNEFKWEKTEKNENEEKIIQTRFNWYRRKILNEKVYILYNNIVSIVGFIKKTKELFRQKLSEIDELSADFERNIITKYKQYNQNYHHINDFLLKIDQLETKLNQFKNAHLYTNNKEFRKSIDSENQSFFNIKEMLNCYAANINEFFTLVFNIKNSIHIFDQIEQEATRFEELSWNKYQELDELINDNNAQSNYLQIVNSLDNLSNYNNYIRNDFLQFFNNGLYNLSTGSENILNAIDDLINNIQSINLKITAFQEAIDTYDKEQKNKILQEEEIKKAELERKNALEAKQKADILKQQNEKLWYQKIIPFFQQYSIKAKEIIILYSKKIVDILTHYYLLLFDKINSIPSAKKHTPTVAQSTDTVVSKVVAAIPPTQNDNPKIILLNEPSKSNQNITPHKIVEIDSHQNTMIALEKEQTEDELTKIHSGVEVKEKKQSSGTSYPLTLRSDAKPNIRNTPGDAIVQNGNIPPILATEEITRPDQINDDQVAKQESLNFKFKPLEKEEQSEIKDNILLPNLSDAQKQNTNNTLNQGISGSYIEAFTPGDATAKRRSENQQSVNNNKDNQKSHRQMKRRKKYTKKIHRTAPKKKIIQHVAV